jgi:hypothetical protein
VSKKFIKQVAPLNGDTVKWWQLKRYDSWVRLDKYGDEADGPGASNSVMLNWLLDGLVELTNECKFEVKAEWPRVFKPLTQDNTWFYIIATEPKERMFRINGDFTIYGQDTMMIAQEWFDSTAYAKAVEVFGVERERALKIHKALN